MHTPNSKEQGHAGKDAGRERRRGRRRSRRSEDGHSRAEGTAPPFSRAPHHRGTANAGRHSQLGRRGSRVAPAAAAGDRGAEVLQGGRSQSARGDRGAARSRQDPAAKEQVAHGGPQHLTVGDGAHGAVPQGSKLMLQGGVAGAVAVVLALTLATAAAPQPASLTVHASGTATRTSLHLQAGYATVIRADRQIDTVAIGDPRIVTATPVKRGRDVYDVILNRRSPREPQTWSCGSAPWRRYGTSRSARGFARPTSSTWSPGRPRRPSPPARAPPPSARLAQACLHRRRPRRAMPRARAPPRAHRPQRRATHMKPHRPRPPHLRSRPRARRPPSTP